AHRVGTRLATIPRVSEMWQIDLPIPIGKGVFTMRERSSIKTGHLVTALAAGAAVGAITALITAPRSGRETRQKLQGWARDMGRKAKRVPQAMSESVDRMKEA